MYGIIWIWAMASVMLFALGCWGLRIAWEIIKTGLVVVFAVFVLAIVGCSNAEQVIEDSGWRTDNEVMITIEDRGVQVTYPAPREKDWSDHLPTKCAQYYNDGTERWINCMGVGYK